MNCILRSGLEWCGDLNDPVKSQEQNGYEREEMSSSIYLANATSSNNSHNGYVEASSEMPGKEMNGERTIRSRRQQSQSKRKKKMVNGKQDGVATLMKDGVPRMKFEYRDRVLTGNSDRMDQYGIVLSGPLPDLNEVNNVVDAQSTIESCSDEGSIRDYLTSIITETDNSLIGYNIGTGEEYGVIGVNVKCYAMKWSDEEKYVIESDLNRCDMRYWKVNHRLVISHENQCIDLDVNGRRWEGGVKDGKPYGYGELFDEEGRKEYEGFMVDGKKVCYGKEYYSDLDRIKYDGCYYEGKRFGNGILYDRNGDVEYDGLWMNDEPHSVKSDGRTIDSHTEVIEIPNKSFNEVESFLLPSFLHSLKQIMIGDECYGSVRLFELNGLSELESIMIGQKSCTYTKSLDEIWSMERNDGSCRIVNCPKLNSIQIGDWSFFDYQSFEMGNLPSLQSIEFGVRCLQYTASFSLIGKSDSVS